MHVLRFLVLQTQSLILIWFSFPCPAFMAGDAWDFLCLSGILKALSEDFVFLLILSEHFKPVDLGLSSDQQICPLQKVASRNFFSLFFCFLNIFMSNLLSLSSNTFSFSLDFTQCDEITSFDLLGHHFSSQVCSFSY